ncbi:cytoskeletal adhesion-domain-containing protein [Dunaliella salina]|uniref:Cytoskeletal adhesion-domain-containing protein n=1 Tax=Dunaliella salina TaxID=3046 RepID=A0ABQ7FTM6_DUNSA|nr:cytoskeletal adhesion-domain-containing protein [Dunaliella salina]|eukprot:KAF5825798.1 cytoskeletal adhesion-domain-containing protein [Dunaliella salina]
MDPEPRCITSFLHIACRMRFAGTKVTQGEAEPQREESTDTSSSNKDNGTLRGRPQNLQPGDTVLRIHIQKWGFKDATLFQQPRVVLSVRDEQGEVLEAVQETPVSKGGTHQYIFFDHTVYSQTAINRLPSGSAIFFEFKHWKEREKKKSCKAYSFLEMDELKDGPAILEAYKKPPNFKRNKQPSLLTTKPLYLHLHLTLERQ